MTPATRETLKAAKAYVQAHGLKGDEAHRYLAQFDHLEGPSNTSKRCRAAAYTAKGRDTLWADIVKNAPWHIRLAVALRRPKALEAIARVYRRIMDDTTAEAYRQIVTDREEIARMARRGARAQRKLAWARRQASAAKIAAKRRPLS